LRALNAGGETAAKEPFSSLRAFMWKAKTRKYLGIFVFEERCSPRLIRYKKLQKIAKEKFAFYENRTHI